MRNRNCLGKGLRKQQFELTQQHRALTKDRHIPSDHTQQRNATECFYSYPGRQLQHQPLEGFPHTSTNIQNTIQLVATNQDI